MNEPVQEAPSVTESPGVTGSRGPAVGTADSRNADDTKDAEDRAWAEAQMARIAGVTDARAVPQASADSRNAERRERHWRAEDEGGTCGDCGRQLAADEPVWRRSCGLGYGGIFGYIRRMAPHCGDCTRESWRGSYLKEPVACEGCARPVFHLNDERKWYRTRSFCSWRCRSNAYAASRRVTPTAHPCEGCGEPVVGRADARYCSGACRQKAYRRRSMPPSDQELEVLDMEP